ncbi:MULTISPECIES: CinA family protein [Chryseobacterium]|uniref:Nicotinamide-nucleotide amidase n=1 Tax=Chryseobacterium camelliae TaxID=1265445 RepID=A0ABU0TH19_9FLAO|nr:MULTISPECIES: nicotinamide-nucleotide amidohydrolase family protein [Chryseobacterium]MDT3405935.1 nicotinamide-nucleotide amidase [Pseudacidovorax intermedius]MDQ1096261.1 nicotinamide-nucleotide amidase [Chryseobacterium camelliae]MDQ1100198.1 nicotinamide-nucleotide amidase [Chryseobacterium sp. SORGH_AS_1048]MDR6087543.1 nicotinamide-nucleotide amidase [Chryseobacterium sp. SORGH_AS_0909]MDR6131917.1 nicotinamide-nucleotide amidase [Chryseobacterium sp. SORGH_AS_1175]
MEFQKNLLDYISHSLITAGQTVSVSESVTSGFLQLAFSQMPNASMFYKGGVTAYALSEKVKLLQVNRQEAEECDCVSANIAETMALNVASLFETDWSIATTGYCTPNRNSMYKIFAYYCISFRGEVIVTKKLELHPKTQAQNAQLYYTEFILGCFKSEINQLLILK